MGKTAHGSVAAMHATPDEDTALGLLDLPAVVSRIREALVGLLGAELAIDLAWPTRRASEVRKTPGVIVSFGAAPASEAHDGWLWLDGAFATNLVDRALGGRGQLGVATASSLPSDAECGVLAYLAARALRGFPGYWVRDVYATREAPPDADVIWPASLRWTHGAGVALLGWSSGALPQRMRVQVGWSDSLANADQRALEVGDVLSSDGVVLSVTSHGLAGIGLARVAGLGERARVVLDGETLHGRTGRNKAQVDDVFVVLHDSLVDIATLMSLGEEGRTSLRLDRSLRVLLTRGEERIAEGELVRMGTRVGVHITAL